MRARFLVIVAALTGVLHAGSAGAQFRQVVPEDMVERSRSRGDAIRFCVNSASALAEFDKEVGAELANLLLIDSEFYDLTYPAEAFPYEYLLSLPEQELFIQVGNNCDAILGFPLPEFGEVFEWLTVTVPYYEPRFVIALAPGSPESLKALEPGSQIGSRLGLIADMYLRSFLRNSQGNLDRRVYPSNRVMINDLSSDDLSAALVWEPAIALAARDDPSISQVRAIDPPFPTQPAPLAIALPSNQTYLRDLLQTAIVEFRDSARFDALLDAHGLPKEAASSSAAQ